MKTIVQLCIILLFTTSQLIAITPNNPEGFIVIKSNPSGAFVYINGEYTGNKTPFQKSFREGNYHFKLVMMDFEDYEGDFTIKSGETSLITPKLIPSHGGLYVSFSPLNDVSVSIDGVLSTHDNHYTNNRLLPGNHTIILNKEHYDEYQESFNITRGKTTNLRIKMTPDHGGVYVSTSPEINAYLFIDGDSIEKTSPCFINYLTPGKHTILFKRKNFDEYSQTFDVVKGENANIKIKMIPNFGGITIKTIPEINAFISIDGNKYENPTPFFIGNLSSGTHHITLSKDDYESYQQNFIIVKGKSEDLVITMKAKFGYITIEANSGDEIFINNEDGDEIILNNEKEGIGRFSGKLMCGNYIINVQNNPNYYSQSKEVKITSGKTVELSFELKPKTGTLSIMVDPIEATIYLNNKPQGKAPKFISNLTTGTYTLKLQKSGYKIFEKQILITENETLAINETLIKVTDSHYNNKSLGFQPSGISSGKYGRDSVTCITNLSLYREFYRQWKRSRYKDDAIDDALKSWEWVFNNCPKATENIYINGAKMIAYKAKHEREMIPKQKLLSDLMDVYDQRIKFFPVKKRSGESQVGEIMGRKGVALYQIDPSKYGEVYLILKKSIETEQKNTRPSVLIYYFRSTIKKAQNGDIDTSIVTDTYNQLVSLTEANISNYVYNSKKWQQWNDVQGNIEASYKDFLHANK